MKAILAIVVLSIAFLVNITGPSVYRILFTTFMFHPSVIVDNFRNVDKTGFPYHNATASDATSKFYSAINYTLPTDNIEKWLVDHYATGFVILKVQDTINATLLYEKHLRGNDATTKTISWSTGKSYVSALVGIAVDEGLINISDRVSKYVPKLADHPYGNVTIKNLLQMSSGIRFNEDYNDTFSDVNMMGYTIALGSDFDNFILTLTKEREQGQILNYISTDTQVLGMALQAAINSSLTRYLKDKVMAEIGVECDLYWLIDNHVAERELYFGTINTCTRDYARFGWLFLNGGKSPLTGRQVISEKWVRDSTTASETHLLPQNTKYHGLGYGYQWWIPYGDDGEYVAIGVYGQFIYVNPRYQIVIAMNSAFAKYPEVENEYEMEAIEMFRKIARESVVY